MADPCQRVSWIEGNVPDTEEAHLVYEAIRKRGITSFEEVVQFVATRLYRHDFTHGGWATDIGIVRVLGAYHRDAREILHRLAGLYVIRIG